VDPGTALSRSRADFIQGDGRVRKLVFLDPCTDSVWEQPPGGPVAADQV
jgi:hypothetical protein